MKVKENKLNWNSLTDEQQIFIDRLVNIEILTLANELIQDAFKSEEYIEIQNEYDEETDEYIEIFQYWIVSDWLYEQLNKIDACTFEYKGLFFWGRTDFNQGLDMNHELKQITRNIIK